MCCKEDSPRGVEADDPQVHGRIVDLGLPKGVGEYRDLRLLRVGACEQQKEEQQAELAGGEHCQGDGFGQELLQVGSSVAAEGPAASRFF